MRAFVLAAVMLAMADANQTQAPGDRPAANPRSTRSVVMARNGLFQGIMIDPRSGLLMGGTDHRKDGLAIGY